MHAGKPVFERIESALAREVLETIDDAMGERYGKAFCVLFGVWICCVAKIKGAASCEKGFLSRWRGRVATTHPP
ncbi:MAG: hypothetical protein LBK01_00160 [Burkholderiaceae bacterium]|nr:hypothetical protein [Burkholderiaceae bacterium]